MQAKEAAALAPCEEGGESGSESELRHDHASRQPLFKKERQAQAAAAKDRAAAKKAAERVKAAEAREPAEKARSKGRGPAREAAAAVTKAAAAAAAKAGEAEDEETEDSHEGQLHRGGQWQAGNKAAPGVRPGAGAITEAKLAAAAASKKAVGAASKRKAAAAPQSKRLRRAAAPAAAGQLAEEGETEDEESGNEETMGGDEFEFADGRRGDGAQVRTWQNEGMARPCGGHLPGRRSTCHILAGLAQPFVLQHALALLAPRRRWPRGSQLVAGPRPPPCLRAAAGSCARRCRPGGRSTRSGAGRSLCSSRKGWRRSRWEALRA